MTETTPQDPTRRRLLTASTWIVSSLLAGLVAIPVVGVVFTPFIRRRGSEPSELTPVAKASDVRPGIPVRVEVVATRIDAWSRHEGASAGAVWLTRNADGSLRAFSSVCPHLGCAVHFDKGRFICPCHDSAFRLDGAVESGPSPRPLDALPVEEHAGEVRVRYARFKQGTKTKEQL